MCIHSSSMRAAKAVAIDSLEDLLPSYQKYPSAHSEILSTYIRRLYVLKTYFLSSFQLPL